MAEAPVEQLLEVRGVQLCAETFGNPGDPPLLLISGAGSSMDYWYDGLCAELAAGSRYVIRYDHRDTGRSSTSPRGKPSYTGHDLTEDPIGILDALGIAQAHLVGISMGGAIAQTLSVSYPDRVRTLVLIATSTAFPPEPGAAELPGMTDELGVAFQKPPAEPDWSDGKAVAAYLLADMKPFSSSLPADQRDLDTLTTRVTSRSHDVGAAANHWLVVEGDAENDGGVKHQLSDIAVSTLVLHGTEDPLFPLPHGEALAAGISGAELITLDGMGHETPPRATWPKVVPAILHRTADKKLPQKASGPLN